jgi:fanconi-associated nuclease 1
LVRLGFHCTLTWTDYLVGSCIRVNESVFTLLRRLNLIYFRWYAPFNLPPISAGIKRKCFSTQHTPDILIPSILSRAQKRTFHPYTCARGSDIWPTRAALLAYERALELEAQVDALNSPLTPNGTRSRSRSVSSRLTSEPPLKSEAGHTRENPLLENDGDVKESLRARCAREVLPIFEVSYAEWKALGDSNCDPRPRGLERFDRGVFTATHVHQHAGVS